MRKMLFSLMGCLITLQCFADSRLYINSKDILISEKGIHFDERRGNYIENFETARCPDCERDYPSYERDCPYKELHDQDNNNDYSVDG